MLSSLSNTKFLTFALTAIVLGAILGAGSQAAAAPTCGELFQSHVEGVLQNRAARATMLLHIRKVLPEGRHEVLVDGKHKQAIYVRYSGLSDVQISMNSRSLVTTESRPLVTGRTGNISGHEGWVQLRSANRVVLASTSVYGDRKSIDGLETRDVEVSISLAEGASQAISIKETVTNESGYRASSTYIVRHSVQRTP